MLLNMAAAKCTVQNRKPGDGRKSQGFWTGRSKADLFQHRNRESSNINRSWGIREMGRCW